MFLNQCTTRRTLKRLISLTHYLTELNSPKCVDRLAIVFPACRPLGFFASDEWSQKGGNASSMPQESWVHLKVPQDSPWFLLTPLPLLDLNTKGSLAQFFI